jgi:hypothetical protein
VLIALVMTLAMIWNQASGARPAPGSGEPLIRAGRRAVRLQEFETFSEPEKQDRRASRPDSRGRRAASLRIRNTLYRPC